MAARYSGRKTNTNSPATFDSTASSDASSTNRESGTHKIPDIDFEINPYIGGKAKT